MKPGIISVFLTGLLSACNQAVSITAVSDQTPLPNPTSSSTPPAPLPLPDLGGSCIYNSIGEAYAAPGTLGPTYYVDGTNGNDSWNGTTPVYTSGTAGPWKTLAKAFDRYTNRSSSGNGVRILIRAGKYYERFSIPDNAHWTTGRSETQRIVVAPYGDGEVIIDGSVSKNLGAWSIYSGSVYQSTFSVAPVNGLVALVMDNDFRSYHPVGSLAAITGPGQWYYDSGTLTLYVWPTFSSPPTGHDVVAVEADVSNSSKYGITIQASANYVTIGGLTVRGNPGANIFTAGTTPYNDHLRIENNKLQYSKMGGIWFTHITNSEISKNYIFGNVLKNWPRGSWATTCSDYSAGGWPPSVAIISNTGTKVSGNIVSWGNGEGIILLDNGTSYGGNIAESNIVSNAYSTGMYFDHGNNSTIRNNFIFSEGFQDADIRTAGCSAGDILGLKRKSRPPGIATANEAGDGTVISSGNRTYNNIILGCNIGIENGDETLTNSGVVNEQIFNNTVILPNYDSSLVNDTFSGIQFGYNNGKNSGTFIRNNLVIAPHPSERAVTWSASGTDTGITWDNNLYYAANTSPFYYKNVGYDFPSWNVQTAQDGHAAFANPLLTRTDWSLALSSSESQAGPCRTVQDVIGFPLSDFIPQVASPARGMGADLSSFSTADFNGTPKEIPMTIGALDRGP